MSGTTNGASGNAISAFVASLGAVVRVSAVTRLSGYPGPDCAAPRSDPAAPSLRHHRSSSRVRKCLRWLITCPFFSPMDTAIKPSFVKTNLVLCLTLGGLLLTSCGSDSSSAKVLFRADPNPVPNGKKTTITWDTGSKEVGEVYVVESGKETLFATGVKGSQETAPTKSGPTLFRLYTQTGHKLLDELKVTMPASADPPSSLSLTTTASPTP
jgi:hypothetical protein